MSPIWGEIQHTKRESDSPTTHEIHRSRAKGDRGASLIRKLVLKTGEPTPQTGSVNRVYRDSDSIPGRGAFPHLAEGRAAVVIKPAIAFADSCLSVDVDKPRKSHRNRVRPLL